MNKMILLFISIIMLFFIFNCSQPSIDQNTVTSEEQAIGDDTVTLTTDTVNQLMSQLYPDLSANTVNKDISFGSSGTLNEIVITDGKGGTITASGTYTSSSQITAVITVIFSNFSFHGRTLNGTININSLIGITVSGTIMTITADSTIKGDLTVTGKHNMTCTIDLKIYAELKLSIPAYDVLSLKINSSGKFNRHSYCMKR